MLVVSTWRCSQRYDFPRQLWEDFCIVANIPAVVILSHSITFVDWIVMSLHFRTSTKKAKRARKSCGLKNEHLSARDRSDLLQCGKTARRQDVVKSMPGSLTSRDYDIHYQRREPQESACVLLRRGRRDAYWGRQEIDFRNRTALRNLDSWTQWGTLTFVEFITLSWNDWSSTIIPLSIRY